MHVCSVAQPSILVIEDVHMPTLLTILKPHAEVVEAATYLEAEEILGSNQPVDAILFDFDLGYGFTTIPLIRAAAKRFGKHIPLIAMTKDPNLRALMMKYGCTHEEELKHRAAELALNLLRQSGKIRTA